MHKNGGRGSIGHTSMHSMMSQSTKNRCLRSCRKRRGSSPCQAQASRLDETITARNQFPGTNELDGRGGLGEHPPRNITRARGGPNTRFAAARVSAVSAPTSRLVLLLRVSYDMPDTHGTVV